MFHERLQKTLIKRLDEHNYRFIKNRQGLSCPYTLYGGRLCLSFCSNDYLGLSHHPKVIASFKKATSIYGVGSGASAIVSGYCEPHAQLEAELAAFMGYPAALLFSTGYMANLGVVQAITGRHDRIFYNRYSHASLIDGILLCRAKSIRYSFDQLKTLDYKLKTYLTEVKASSNPNPHALIISNGVSSTTGEISPLPKLIAIAQSHQAWLMIDDAHGIGCLGTNGRGSLEYHQVNPQDINVLVGTLSKAFGTFGAFVLGNQTVIETLRQTARTHLFTTAIPPAIAMSSCESLKIIQNEPERRQHLQTIITYFRKAANQLQLPLLPSETPIQSLLIGSSQLAEQLSQRLLHNEQLLVKSFRPPTVPKQKALLRLAFCSEHTRHHVDQLLSAIKKHGSFENAISESSL